MKIERLINIIMTLLANEIVNASNLAKQFEVSTRTIYRDIDTLLNAGIPIFTIPGPNGGIGIMDTYKVDKGLFSTSDITSLLMGLENMKINLPNEELNKAINKIKSMIPMVHKDEINMKSNRVQIDMKPWHGKGDLPNNLNYINPAIENQNIIEFEYMNRSTNKSTRQVEPYRLLLKGMHWYLYAYCKLREDFRIFKVLRMKNINVLDEKYKLRDISYERLEKPKSEKEFKEFVSFKIHESIWDEMVLHFGEDSISKHPTQSDYFILTAQIPVHDYMCRFFLGFGNLCECIEPESMKLKIKNLALTIAQLY